MSFSYSGNPAESPKDAVRFRIRDVDEDEPKLTDEEIAFLLAQNVGDINLAAAEAAESIARVFAASPDFTIGGYRESYQATIKFYESLAASLREQATAIRGGISATGLSQREKDSDRMDQDLVQPAFRRDLHDIPGGNLTRSLRGDE